MQCHPKSALVAIAICLIALPLAADTPEWELFETTMVDLDGQPLDHYGEITVHYFDLYGERLLVESFVEGRVAEGQLSLDLGRGEAQPTESYSTVAEVFAAYAELEIEVVLDEAIQEPRIGILPAGHSLKSTLVAAGVRPANDNDPHWEGYESKSPTTAFQSGVLAPAGSRAQGDTDSVRSRPYTLPIIGPHVSPSVRSLARRPNVPQVLKERERNAPRHETVFDRNGQRFGTGSPKVDDFAVQTASAGTQTPGLDADFAGMPNISGFYPPDTEGTVGPNHYIQVVNSTFAIYSKTGTLLAGPSDTNELWSGMRKRNPCRTDNSGDAIFLYDQGADRFVLTQFAVAKNHRSVCFAISQTGDPLGSYYLYEVVTPRFPDYFKLGVWPEADNNAYFMGTNSGYQDQYDVFALDRANMLAGNTARPMQFFQNFYNLMMPADVDGSTPPPAGSPGLFYTFRDGGEPYFGSPANDSLDVWEFDVDWNSPSNSTFVRAHELTSADGLADFNWTVCGFFASNCLPQPGTSVKIDSASWWPMQRLVYRNFGSHEAMVGSWTVDVLAAGDRAAPRWFELRSTGGAWSIHQQGTHSPDATHRWMPSIAMDASGNIALGYSHGDGSSFPSIYYATRDEGDPLGTLQAEALMFAGTGSQTGSAGRWGDYSSMELDPADDCTFWYTTEYLASTGGAPWLTRVASFRVPSCTSNVNLAPVVSILAPADGTSVEPGDSVTFSGSANDAEDGDISASLDWSSNLDGSIGSGSSFSTTSLSEGDHTITASATDSGGLTGSAIITLTVSSGGSCLPVGASCVLNADCCSNKCKGPPSNKSCK